MTGHRTHPPFDPELAAVLTVVHEHLSPSIRAEDIDQLRAGPLFAAVDEDARWRHDHRQQSHRSRWRARLGCRQRRGDVAVEYRLAPEHPDPLADARERGRRVVSICTGAFALAAAGVLAGLHATTHWKHVDELERDFPAITIDRDVLYVDEGDVLTSAGVCGGIDLGLHIVRRDLGAAVANGIARGLVAAPHRDGGQAQYVPAPVAMAGDSSLAPTREWALRRLGEPLTLRVLARHAGVSQRTFLRRFAEETGMTPLQWLLDARLGRARERLETTGHSVDGVARECGLGTAANLRLHFRRALGTTPTAYRRTFTH